jgi:hypothetical protein
MCIIINFRQLLQRRPVRMCLLQRAHTPGQGNQLAEAARSAGRRIINFMIITARCRVGDLFKLLLLSLSSLSRTPMCGGARCLTRL